MFSNDNKHLTQNNKETRAEATTVDDEKGESNAQNSEVKIETAKEEDKEENSIILTNFTQIIKKHVQRQQL